jgi:cytochrome c oxidase subunit 1
MPLFYLGYSIFFGAKAPANPWGATGLEWQTPSPPPKYNFERQPVVSAPPYDYEHAPEPQNV